MFHVKFGDTLPLFSAVLESDGVGITFAVGDVITLRARDRSGTTRVYPLTGSSGGAVSGPLVLAGVPIPAGMHDVQIRVVPAGGGQRTFPSKGDEQMLVEETW